MEILARTHVPHAPVASDEIARKADVGASFGAAEPDHPHVGMLWATPDRELFVWTGIKWLQLIPPETPTGPAIWDGGATVWDGGATTWDT